MMATEPVARAVTTPLAEMVASPASLVDHATLWSDTTLPAPSRTTADACIVWPGRRLELGRTTVTDATGTGGEATAIAAVPLTPPDVAVTTELPGAMAVASPELETVTAAGLELDQVTDGLVATLPEASTTVAESCCVDPGWSSAVAGETVILEGGGAVTERAVLPTFASLIALIVAAPAAIPVTRPEELTVASAGLELCQATMRPVTTRPVAS
jgi:hypothetical protein